MKMDWRSSAACARLLLEQNRWSKCIYGYMEAAFLCQRKAEEGLTPEEEERLADLMK